VDLVINGGTFSHSFGQRRNSPFNRGKRYALPRSALAEKGTKAGPLYSSDPSSATDRFPVLQNWAIAQGPVSTSWRKQKDSIQPRVIPP